MMENNIFKNAYFGKAYKTRSGEKALYSGKTLDNTLHILFFNNGSYARYFDNGEYYNIKAINNIGDYKQKLTPYDIISEWADEDKPNTTNKYKLLCHLIYQYVKRMVLKSCIQQQIYSISISHLLTQCKIMKK